MLRIHIPFISHISLITSDFYVKDTRGELITTGKQPLKTIRPIFSY